MFNIVLFQPEIPPNTGNVMRLAAVTGCQLHLVEPLGFEMDDAKLRRAGMDYRDRAVVTVHSDIDSCRKALDPGRIFALTVDGEASYSEIAYRAGDTFLFGPESVGLPVDVKDQTWITGRVRLPMVPDVRSINLANAVAIVVYEGWRQHGFIGAR